MIKHTISALSKRRDEVKAKIDLLLERSAKLNVRVGFAPRINAGKTHVSELREEVLILQRLTTDTLVALAILEELEEELAG
jgi:hypothetical protein